jgi:basic amino acid/polyamine antiporter, APA family
VAAVAVATTVLKIAALAIVAVAGLLTFHAGDVGPVRAHGGSWSALPSASALLLFSFVGMEGVAVATNRVHDPERNVPRAILVGVAGVAVLYPLALFTTLALLSTSCTSSATSCPWPPSSATRSPGAPAAARRGGTLAIVAIALAMVFSVWMAGATGAEAVQRGTVLILIGIPVYVLTRRTNPSGRSGALC